MTETERNLDLLLGDALSENERLKSRLKYQDDQEGWVGTHGPDCWTYEQGGIECIEAIRAALTEEEFRGYCKGNAMKYIWRERHKGGKESVEKAAWYLDYMTQCV